MAEKTRIIKKYPNRRLYDTATSSYITLEDVRKLVHENTEFRVEDAKTKEDLTRSILLQIILDAEGDAGSPMFSSDMLSKIIRCYGDAMQGMMSTYLEKNIQTFVEIQKKLQEQSNAMSGGTPLVNAAGWAEFLKMQGPAIQGLMGSYLEQSASAFLDMQQQMQKQTRNLFGNLTFPNFAANNPFAPKQSEDANSTPNKSGGKDEGGNKDGG